MKKNAHKIDILYYIFFKKKIYVKKKKKTFFREIIYIYKLLRILVKYNINFHRNFHFK